MSNDAEPTFPGLAKLAESTHLGSGLKALFTMNGGAAVAVLALMSTLVSGNPAVAKDVAGSLWHFALGTASAAVAPLFYYRVQMLTVIFQEFAKAPDAFDGEFKGLKPLHFVYGAAANLLTFAAVLFFLLGIWQASSSLTSLSAV